MIDVAMDMEQYDCPFIDTTDDHDVSFSTVHWEFDTATERLETRMVVEAEGRDVLEGGLSDLRDHEHLHEYDLFMKCDGVGLIRTVIDQTNAMRTIRDNGGYVTGPFHIEGGSECWEVGFDDEGVADATLAELERHNEFTVTERTTLSAEELFDVLRNAGPAADLLGACRSLSTVERETLALAVERGYFGTPRGETLSSLGEQLDVSDTAVSSNLRRAERKLLERVVDALAELEEERVDGAGNEALN
jgi:predicted DNA binding protein